jgi:hypothetical protein
VVHPAVVWRTWVSCVVKKYSRSRQGDRQGCVPLPPEGIFESNQIKKCNRVPPDPSQTDIQTCRHTHKQTDKQTDKQVVIYF